MDHCIDVAATFRRIAELPAIRRSLSLACGQGSALDEAQLDRLAVVALLHDLGKCNRGFQAKRDPLARDTAGHVLEAGVLLLNIELQQAWPAPFRALTESLCEWFPGNDDEALAMLLAAISHHGRPVSRDDVANFRDRSAERWWRARGGLDPMHGLAQLVRAARACFPRAFDASQLPLNATPALQQRFAGLVMLADWIGSDTAFFPFRADEAEDRVARARDFAERAVRGIGLQRPQQGSATTSFFETFGFAASPLQRMLAEDLPVDDDSRLVLVESDTGSGKTEAALAWFLRLYVACEVDALYFALPTRVAARELYGRVCRTVERAFPDPQQRPGPLLLAAPGYARVDDQPGILPGPEGRLWEDDAALRRHERQWAAEHPKRFLAAPVAVGTVDQALLSVLKVKHALLRSVCLDRSLLVIDEVHASDPYMRQTLHALLAGHLERGGRALLLSATLGDSAGSAFFDRALRPLDEATHRPYPSLSTLKGERAIVGRAKAKQVAVEFAAGLDDADVLPRIIAAIVDGARVLVVCNTVARANALMRALESHSAVPLRALFAVNGTACPHHGRFARDHREVMDAAVTAALGKGSPAGARLVVGTQTLEQSLDIDADLLVTDPCPMDVLLQRIGRLHRHAREDRPASCAAARVLLRAPADGDLRRWLRPDGRLRGPAGLGTVYADGRVVQRTLDLLRTRPAIEIPADNRWLVEHSTHPDALARLLPEWRQHAEHVEGEELAQIRAALTGAIDDQSFGELHYASPDERVATRLGAGNLDLKLAQPLSHPFGILVRSVAVPAHMAPRDAPAPDSVAVEEFEDGFRFALGAKRYRYTRYGLEDDDA